jgi:RNA recognition motif-containing protein
MNKSGINIYVSNVARNVTEDQLRNLFAQHGQVRSVKIIKDKFTGEVRGFAFVEMEDTAQGNAAIAAVNGQTLEGQQLRVNEARPREERDDRGPRRPYNGGGNRGGFDRGPRY